MPEDGMTFAGDNGTGLPPQKITADTASGAVAMLPENPA